MVSVPHLLHDHDHDKVGGQTLGEVGHDLLDRVRPRATTCTRTRTRHQVSKINITLHRAGIVTLIKTDWFDVSLFGRASLWRHTASAVGCGAGDGEDGVEEGERAVGQVADLGVGVQAELRRRLRRQLPITSRKHTGRSSNT